MTMIIYYVADYYTVKKVNLTTNSVTTIAGSSQGYASNCNGNLAKFDAMHSVKYRDNKLYAYSYLNAVVFEIDLSNSNYFVKTLAGKDHIYQSVYGPAPLATFSGTSGFFFYNDMLFFTAGQLAFIN